MPSSAATFWKNLSLICSRMPTRRRSCPPRPCRRGAPDVPRSAGHRPVSGGSCGPLMSTTARCRSYRARISGRTTRRGVLRSVNCSILSRSPSCLNSGMGVSCARTGWDKQNGAPPMGAIPHRRNAFVRACTIPYPCGVWQGKTKENKDINDKNTANTVKLRLNLILLCLAGPAGRAGGRGAHFISAVLRSFWARSSARISASSCSWVGPLGAAGAASLRDGPVPSAGSSP